MALGILGKKLGMSQVFDEKGVRIPVTVIEAGPCMILQKKMREPDGYVALQLGFDPKSNHATSKPERGHAKKADTIPMRYVREVRVDNPEEYTIGQVLLVDIFNQGDRVDITGLTKGRGFAGPIKRHGSRRGPETHGSRYHRRPGSLGASSYPSRVFKGKPLPGRMGNNRCTAQNLQVVKTDKGKNLLVVKGSVPGAATGYLIIRKRLKGNHKKK